MSKILLVGFGPLLLAAAPLPTTIPDGEEPLVDVGPLHPSFLVDMKYATEDNFFGKKVYPVARCALRKSVAERMVAAQAWLEEHHRGLRLMFKDCYRPDRVQWIMWDSVKGTKKAGYVANPNTGTGSIHSYGAAVDLTLADADGKEVDMGTPYDFLGRLAQPRYEDEYLRSGKLTNEQVERRRILRKAMLQSGMKMIRNEWWHFNADSSSKVKKMYSRLNVPLSAVGDKEK